MVFCCSCSGASSAVNSNGKPCSLTVPIKGGKKNALREFVACCFVELINLTCTIAPVKFQSLLDVLFQLTDSCTSHLTNESAFYVT